MVYGFGKIPMMLITNLKSDDKRICTAICKVYLMRWRIEEYFKFKKQSFDFENIRVQSLKSIRNLDLLLTIAIGYVAEIWGIGRFFSLPQNDGQLSFFFGSEVCRLNFGET